MEDAMQSPPLDLPSLAARVEKLESQNRLLRRVGLAFLLLPLTLIVMAQAQPPRNLEAQSFVLRDSSGIKRAELSMGQEDAELRYMGKDDPVLRFFNSKGQQTSTVGDGIIFLIDPKKSKAPSPFVGDIMLSMAGGEPSIDFGDTNGFHSFLGVTDTITTRTGEQHQTSAASITLEGKDRKVLWSAP